MTPPLDGGPYLRARAGFSGERDGVAKWGQSTVVAHRSPYERASRHAPLTLPEEVGLVSRRFWPTRKLTRAWSG